MSASNYNGKSTLDIDDFEPVTDGEPVEFEPDDYNYDGDEQPGRSFAERLLSIITLTLAVLLTVGSVVFWCYFVRRLSICPASIDNYRLYPVMLITCAAVTAAVTVAQIMRRRTYPSTDSWMVSICVSGAITTLLMTVYNSVVLGHAFEWADVIPTVCFSASGCALPAAILALVWALGMLLRDHVRYENSRDKAAVYADVLAQCEGRF